MYNKPVLPASPCPQPRNTSNGDVVLQHRKPHISQVHFMSLRLRRRMKPTSLTKKLRLGGLLTVSALLLAGCAGSVGDTAGDADRGASVEPGASKEEYAEALADMEPVELTFQAASSATGGNGARDTAFAEAIEEWSDGKISVEVLFGYPIVAPSEVASALQDGR